MVKDVGVRYLMNSPIWDFSDGRSGELARITCPELTRGNPSKSQIKGMDLGDEVGRALGIDC